MWKDHEAFQHYFDHLLAKYELSQRSLSKKCTVHWVTISHMLNDPKRLVEFATIEELANGFNCTKAERYTLHVLAGTVPGELLAAMREVLSHWREFGPEHGFGECMDTTLAPFIDEWMDMQESQAIPIAVISEQIHFRCVSEGVAQKNVGILGHLEVIERAAIDAQNEVIEKISTWEYVDKELLIKELSEIAVRAILSIKRISAKGA